jgi:hypothetical protein
MQSGSPVARTANVLTTEVDLSDREASKPQSSSCRSPQLRDEIRDLSGASSEQADARITMPVLADEDDRYSSRWNRWWQRSFGGRNLQWHLRDLESNVGVGAVAQERAIWERSVNRGFAPCKLLTIYHEGSL